MTLFGFWVIAALFLMFPLLIIIFTLLKTYDANDSENDHRSDIYQQRLNEINADIDNGLLSQADADNVKQEMQLALLNQSNGKKKSTFEKESDTPIVTIALLLVLLPVSVIGLYQHIGKPELIRQTALLSEFNNAENQEAKLASVEKMLNQLEQRLMNEPDDVDGWLMLTNSYTALERYPEALKAVDNLYRLRGDDPSVMLKYADILSMVNDGLLVGRPSELIHEALKIDPENPNGLWLAGLAANERGDVEDAAKHWELLLPKLEQGTESQQKIKEYIQIALGKSESGTTSALSDNKIALTVNVSLSDKLSEESNSNDTIYIYATALEGPAVPLAIAKKNVSDLPIDIVLTDALSMIATHKLSDHKKVQLIARISKSGDAAPQSGDYIGKIDSVKTNTKETLNLIIDQIIP